MYYSAIPKAELPLAGILFGTQFPSLGIFINKSWISKKLRPPSIQTSVSKGQDVPGQTGTGRPVVPLSRDKKKLLVPVSRCPGTRAGANVPGQTPLSRDKMS